jgi:uncharacterized protein YbjT (DUF2867 family)
MASPRCGAAELHYLTLNSGLTSLRHPDRRFHTHPGALGLQALRQPVVSLHRSHLLVLFRQWSEALNATDLPGGRLAWNARGSPVTIHAWMFSTRRVLMQAGSKIAVAGATGRVGRHVVDVLKAQGHAVVSMSRSSGVDLVSGDGLAPALSGAECIIDVASWPSSDQAAATEFFTAATRNLHAAGLRAGVQRIVVVSIIGADRFSAGYNVAKVAHERAMLAGPIPVRILRAAQFHEFVAQLVEWGRQGEVSYVPKMRTQLVAARTVAQALADLATESAPAPGAARAPIVEIAGPREESLVDMAVLFAARRGIPVRIEGVSDAADPNSDLFENGALLPGPDATLAGPTFEEWLDSTTNAITEKGPIYESSNIR